MIPTEVETEAPKPPTAPGHQRPRGNDRIPARVDYADLKAAHLVHRAYRLYGEGLASGDEAALHEFLTAAAELPKVYRYLVRDLVVYAHLVIAHHALPDDRRGDGRHVLDLVLAGRVLGVTVAGPAAGFVQPGRDLWKRIHSAAWDVLLGVDEVTGAPTGRTLRQLLGQQRRAGAALVGLTRRQREILADQGDQSMALISEAVDVALQVMAKWGARPADELLRLALPDPEGRSRLDLFAVVTTDRLTRRAAGITRKARARRYEPGDTTGWWDRLRPEASVEPVPPPKEAEAAVSIAAVLARADLTETQRRRLSQMVEVYLAWEGEGPTRADLAHAMKVSVPYVKKLRSLVADLAPGPR